MKKIWMVFLIILAVTGVCHAQVLPGNSTENLTLTANNLYEHEKLSWEDYQGPETSTAGRSLIASIIGFIWKLALVIFLLYLTMRILKYLYGGRVSSDHESSLINILDSYYLKANQAIFMVEIVDQYFVLGVTNNNITLISEITDKEKIRDLLRKKEKNMAPDRFKNNLLGLFRGKSTGIDNRIAESSQRILDNINKISKG